MSGAHPRSRGENPPPVRIGVADPGSSPLTRGKHPFGCRREPFSRLIPAHAGKTRTAGRPGIRPRAHPRSRGENMLRRKSPAYMAGSSPLTRGKLRSGLGNAASARLIPAHAGKTTRLRRSFLTGWAHPRSRGENAAASAASLTMRGSSPLTRGKPVNEVPERLALGLIPAHAGKTSGAELSPSSDEAHPRSRGENVFMIVVVATLTGSSPLTRGKHVGRQSVIVSVRLIPAHAGKTTRPTRPPCRREAHPRSRGENPPAG